MSGLDFFGGMDSGEGYDPAAFERFKEKIKKNGQFVAALRKQENKQKKKEEQLIALLMRFFQTHRSNSIVLLAARLLEQNIPAVFILQVILLGNEELKREADAILRLAGCNSNEKDDDFAQPTQPSVDDSMALMPQFNDASMPLRVKVAIDEWGRGLLDAAREQPYRLLETALDGEGNVKPVVVDCMAQVVQGFFESHNIENFSYDKAKSFCQFLVQGILEQIRKELEERKLLGEIPED
jgi:hypothetical protein